MLTLENATISQITFKTGDLVVKLIGENMITKASSILSDTLGSGNASITLMGGGTLNCRDIHNHRPAGSLAVNHFL